MNRLKPTSKREFFIGRAPAVVYGESDKVFVFVHGMGGNKYEAERFYNVVGRIGYAVLAVDLPRHGNRTDDAEFVAREAVRDLKNTIRYAKNAYKDVSVRATSIGAYFSCVAFRGEKTSKCLFVSPLLNMRRTIADLMAAAGVSEELLRTEKEIPTEFGQTLSWDYLCYARANPVRAVCADTAILYATGDEVVPRDTVETFARENGCSLTEIDGYEHYLHTDEEIGILEKWEYENTRI